MLDDWSIQATYTVKLKEGGDDQQIDQMMGWFDEFDPSIGEDKNRNLKVTLTLQADGVDTAYEELGAAITPQIRELFGQGADLMAVTVMPQEMFEADSKAS